MEKVAALSIHMSGCSSVNRVALAVAEAAGLDAMEIRERPCEAGGRILSPREEHEGPVAHGEDYTATPSAAAILRRPCFDRGRSRSEQRPLRFRTAASARERTGSSTRRSRMRAASS